MSKYVRQKTIELQGEIDKVTFIVGDFNTTSLVIEIELLMALKNSKGASVAGGRVRESARRWSQER